jgi:threonine dehydrogenase-like Zn-dependent dehydrogenase
LRVFSAGGSIVATSPESSAAIDVVIEASGDPTAIELSLRLLHRRGRLVIAGDYGGATVTFDPTEFVHRNLAISGSNASSGTWDLSLALASAGRVALAPLISLDYPIEDWRTAIDVADRDPGVIKVCLKLEDT